MYARIGSADSIRSLVCIYMMNVKVDVHSLHVIMKKFLLDLNVIANPSSAKMISFLCWVYW